jgi:predicted amidophosphoribosyltransferase
VFCSKCGIDLTDDTRFCRGCGKTLDVVSIGGGAAAAVAPARIPAPEPKSANAIRNMVGTMLLLAFLPVAPSEEP